MYHNKINGLAGRQSKPEKVTLQYEFNDIKIVHEFSGEITLQQALEHYEQFLLGCGYRFNGTLDIIDDEKPPEVVSVSTQEMLLEELEKDFQ